MEFKYNYAGSSSVSSDANASSMNFIPDTLRDPTYFHGKLNNGIAFREAISALHDVVVSDLRWQPKDKTEYKAWLAKQELIDWADIAAQSKTLKAEIAEIRQEIKDISDRRQSVMGPFYNAQRRYFDYLYKTDMDYWMVLDPVITVHPDELFFECFSQDESSYGRLSVDYDHFKDVGEFACGTTNVDYSANLYNEFQKIRSYKDTQFTVDPSGFEAQSGVDEAHKEVKIDLPDTWVRGFLQVNSAMSLPAASFELHPMDIHNMCLILRRKKEIKGPRSIRFILEPGKPIRMRFDPWNTELRCGRSIYTGKEAQEIRVWGRRRIHILERLIPVAQSFTVHLLGNGMPSFYVAHLNGMRFTLGLSGWTANDWSASGNFDLLAPRQAVDAATSETVFNALKKTWFAKPDELAQQLQLDRSVVLGALSQYTQAGSAIWDLAKGVYRARELSSSPLPMDKLRFSNEREEHAMRFINDKAISQVRYKTSTTEQHERIQINGQIKVGGGIKSPQVILDQDQRIIDAVCDCNWHQQNALRKGPCEHILALRMHATRNLETAAT